MLDTAVKYMGDQPILYIWLGFRVDDEPAFFVRDNGIGIDPKYHDKVFGLFDQLDASNEGTGEGWRW